MRARQKGAWVELSYSDLADRIQDLSLGLLDLGIAPGDRVAILSENRPEWAIADYACLTARCTDVPIYPTLPAKQVEHNLRDSGAVAVFASTRHQLEKLNSIRQRLPELRHIIVFDGDGVDSDVLTLDQVAQRGRTAEQRRAEWKRAALEVKPD